MDSRKGILWSVIGLSIIMIGITGLLIMGFPAGLLILVPSAVPHLVRIYHWMKK